MNRQNGMYENVNVDVVRVSIFNMKSAQVKCIKRFKVLIDGRNIRDIHRTIVWFRVGYNAECRIVGTLCARSQHFGRNPSHADVSYFCRS
jgi:hypothetical protein